MAHRANGRDCAEEIATDIKWSNLIKQNRLSIPKLVWLADLSCGCYIA